MEEWYGLKQSDFSDGALAYILLNLDSKRMTTNNSNGLLIYLLSEECRMYVMKFIIKSKINLVLGEIEIYLLWDGNVCLQWVILSKNIDRGGCREDKLVTI